MSSAAGRVSAGFIAALGCLALLLQFALVQAVDSPTGWVVRTVNFFGYFTILSNLLATTVFAALALAPATRLGAFAARPATMTAMTIYLSVTGLIYFVLLRPLWAPQGWQFIADTALHYAMPALTLLYWLFFVPKGDLRLAHLPGWLVFPLAYGSYALLRAPFAGFYPYPFIDVATLGYAGVLRNMAVLLVGFVAIGALYLLVDRLLGRLR